jgi:hypothetical protein
MYPRKGADLASIIVGVAARRRAIPPGGAALAVLADPFPGPMAREGRSAAQAKAHLRYVIRGVLGVLVF